MTKGSMIDSQCTETLRRLDQYMDNELDGGGLALVVHHLEGCPACFQELELRRRLRSRLKNAVENSARAPYLNTRVLANIRAAEHNPGWRSWRRQVLAAVAMVLVAVGVTAVAYQLGHLRLTTSMQEGYIATVSSRIPGILRVGLGDHVHCSVFRKYSKQPPSPAEMSGALGSEYRALLDAVQPHIPDGFQLVMAHKCKYHGRQFVHISLKRDSQLISLVITRRQSGESFSNSALLPVVKERSLPIYTDRVQRFDISGFETKDHLAYLVSNLPKETHSDLMLALAPGIQSVLQKLDA
jgi:hypothetical protein